MIARLLALPIPLFAGVAMFELPSEIMESAPTWIIVFFAGIGTAVWVAEKFGRLPGGNGERRKERFTVDDRARLEKVCDLLTDRDDDGIGRFVMQAKQTRETNDTVARIAKLLEQQARHLEMIAEWIGRQAAR